MLDETSLAIILSAAGLVVSLITMVLVIVCLKKIGAQSAPVQSELKASVQAAATSEPAATSGLGVSGVVFCRNCGNQFETTNAVCPSCKTPRGYLKED